MPLINLQPSSKFPMHILAIAILTILSPEYAQALSLAQSPPGQVNPRVAPNVILSLDNSTSMTYDMDGNTRNIPEKNKRLTILKEALKAVFLDDLTIVPDGQIRLAWQVMHPAAGKLNGKISALNADAASKDISTSTPNLMRVLDSAHRQRFKEFIDNFSTGSGTPTHKLVSDADAYMRAPLHKNGPWADTPGSILSAEDRNPLGCRRNYHVLLTDGEWNNIGNQDYVSTVPGNYDGEAEITFPHPEKSNQSINYDLTSDQTQIYRDKDYSDSKNEKSVVADWAFYSWAKPLQDQSNLTGKVQPNSSYYNATEEVFTSKDGKSTITLEPFWNPKYNPATWPHMVTFTIGFSNDAVPQKNYDSNGKSTNITHPSSLVPYGYDGDFAHYATGTYTWKASKDKGHDMWHAAINGRGEFYQVTKPEDLKKAFESIIGTINMQSEPDRSTSTATGTSSERKPVGVFTTFNQPKEAWSGGVKSYTITNGEEKPAWEGKSTAEILDQRTTPRTIITTDDAGITGKAFKWENLTSTQKSLLKTGENNSIDSDLIAEYRLNYIRGDRSREKSKTNGIFRNRYSIQGDIVNSSVWYVGAPISDYTHPGYNKFINDKKSRTPMIYVGGNDGMLHGFSATDGEEKLAYIPKGVYSNLSRLTWPSFDENHRYYVDGSPMTGDVDIHNNTAESPEWRTMLVGTLGGGGKGYFILDITNPDTDFTENNAKNILVLDKTMSASEEILCTASDCLEHEAADIGHIFSTPTKDESNPLKTTQIAFLNNNRWAVILGNGYNSKNQRPVLLIQYLDGAKELLRIPATPTTAQRCTIEQLAAAGGSMDNSCHNVTDNGLSAPTLVDINGDNRPDIVYAGDIKGNIWKFIISSKDSKDWEVAFDNAPLYTAMGGIQGDRNNRSLRQPITAAPIVRANDRSYTDENGKVKKVGGLMISFGTGRNITTDDPQNTDIQSLYSVLDRTHYKITTIDKKQYVSIHPGDEQKNIPVPEPVGMGVNDLAKQSIDVINKYPGEENNKGRDYWAMDESNSVSIDWNSHKGWYLDFPEMGERLLKNMEFYDGSNILAIYSQVPAKGSNITENLYTESCEASTVDEERQYLTLLNIMDGQRPSVQLMDQNGDGQYDLVTDKYVSRQRITKGAHTRVTDKKHVTDYGQDDAFNLARMPEQSLRPSWRQLQ